VKLIALDKCPGVRPIGIGETVQRIVSKEILSVLKFDMLQAVGSSRLCPGQESGCESAIHTVCELFNHPETETNLLFDASITFSKAHSPFEYSRLLFPLSVPLINIC